MSVNYLEQINGFQRWKEVNPLPASAIALWYELLATCNKAGWPEEFTVRNAVIQASAGLSRKQFDSARQMLIDMGLIRYKKSQRVNSAGKYSMNYFPIVQNGHQKGQQKGQQEGHQKEHRRGNKRDNYINKTKLNETNIYLSSSGDEHEENAKDDGVLSTEPSEAEISSFKQIEAKYIQRRARGFDLMPNDILVIEQLLQDGIPVDTIMQGIDKAFDEYKPRFKNDRIKSMTYCEPIIRELHYLNENRKEANERAKTRKSAGHGRD